MDFGLKDFEIVENQNSISTSPDSEFKTHSQQVRGNSLILSELAKEVEELQTKLKLNYRRLLLFEAENTKLAEEKNKYFIEAQSFLEKNKLTEETLVRIETESDRLYNELRLAQEKIQNLETINQSQIAEIRRFSKFHLKIQNTVKPFIEQLKNQLLRYKKEIQSYQCEINLFKKLNQDLEKNNSELVEKKATLTSLYEKEKNDLIQSYEDQIHFLSKEILAEQNHNSILEKDILRLKKAVEFKNYFENELIKFKRIHEDDQINLYKVSEKANYFEVQCLNKDIELNQLKNELNTIQNKLIDSDHLLETTRNQLYQQIEENRITQERLNRLEKLNANLSKELT